MIPVILCGGAGTRLQPLSSHETPKQFLKLVDPEKSLLQKTFDRALALTGITPSSVVIVTHESHAKTAREQLGEFSPHVLTETMSRNTAPAIALAADYISRNFLPDDIMFVLPCDGHIQDETELHKALSIAKSQARNNRITIFGITPHRPETSYGYIKTGLGRTDGAYEVACFVEKPNHETALTYLNSGEYLWNSGMSVFKAQTALDEFKTHAPEILEHLGNYEAIKPVAFDVAILEKSNRLSVIPCDLEWSDIGTWTGLFEILQKNKPQVIDLDKSKARRN